LAGGAIGRHGETRWSRRRADSTSQCWTSKSAGSSGWTVRSPSWCRSPRPPGPRRRART
jgi:hypothetical protein